MYAKKRKFPLSLILIFVLLGVLIGSAAAKYIYSEELTSTVTFSASLAESLLLQEHEAVRQADGSYKLNTSLLPTDTKKGNTYELLPGLDVPKDPFVTVVNKTPIGAYLYIEVQSSLNSAITYEIDTDNWTLLNIDGKDIYVYKNGLILTNENCPTTGISILKTPDGAAVQIKVSQHLLTQDTTPNVSDDILTFSAYLYEVHDNKTPAEIFKEHSTT